MVNIGVFPFIYLTITVFFGIVVIYFSAIIAKEKYKCYKRRKERLNNGDTLEFM